MRVPNLIPTVRDLFRTGTAAGMPPRNPSANPAAAVQTRQAGPLSAPPPLNVSQQPNGRTALTRRRGGGTGPGGADDAVVVRTRDPHTEAAQAQFHLQGISSAASVSNDAKDGSGKIGDWFMQLLGITGTPR
jgi:hypothetical protein